MAIHCPECGEQILSKRVGFCPGCRRPLPEAMRLDDATKERMDAEFERTLRPYRGGGSGFGGDGGIGWADGGCDGGGGCGGD